MVDNIPTKSALQGSLSSDSSLPLQTPSASSHISFPGSLSHQPANGGMKLEAVMENLQRQQAARLALEEKLRHTEKDKDLRCTVESQIHQQTLAFRHYQAAMQGALVAGVSSSSQLGTLQCAEVRREDGNGSTSRTTSDLERKEEGDEMKEQGIIDENEEDEDGSESNHYYYRHFSLQGACLNKKSAQMHVPRRVSTVQARRTESPPVQPQSHNHEWTYEEQFKQLYELDNDEKRKEFLDDLFSFMQKRGTPVNRIPIMAKQVLDLYMLYKLVTEKGGLVEVINKKIWREITKGLNLPTSITSAAFTLRTQYMKYLYPYECEKRGLSSPGELQAAIDSNRREGRRHTYNSSIFSYSPVGTPTLLPSPKIQMSHLPALTHNNNHISQVSVIKKEEPMMSSCLPSQVALSMLPSGHHAAAVAAQAAALEQLKEKLESGEPPEKKMMIVAEEQQWIMQHALQQNLLAMATQLPLNIKLNNRDDRQDTALNLSTNGISSINMSIEINGVVYTGILFARQSAIVGTTGHHSGHQKHIHCHTQGKTSPPQFQPTCSSSSTSSFDGQKNSSP
ncbi:AT-rich interactive domain-containing protein 3A isoform X1 [Echeneis naucrates]|uniref:AT-rich interactive domain-containing protein 3A isoform X1 n=1 Tax=Echeneis naucrates TaxID=173247 RepID=UPI001114164B|nr:AT-rich interactive domain-containing protein 3A-like isoform X1 [Echeneis naucrates]